ncbi:MAG: hypothetical protein ISQ58_06355 [Pseudomonadales bacterium]|nr:hypothetical protein [Pseudomonadales bacterium]MBL6905420.1 hypothetical protein [Pseudomonadales bacterium]
MAKVSDSIPETLQPEVDAAINWFNAQSSDDYTVTGIVDAEQSLASTDERELRLVLCGDDMCQQKKFNVRRTGDSFTVSLTDEPPISNGTQAELDPPPGARKAWLDNVISKHKFVVLVFYRGFW